jgi:hypothetical protein
MNNIYVFAFATFGHPNDFKQSAFVYDQKSFVKNIKKFDLTNAIKVFPDSTIYAIRKELVNGLNAVSYSIYTYAQEQKSTREGTFIGSSIVYTNGIEEEDITIDKLLSFHNALIKNNTIDDILTVNHSDNFIIPPNVISDFDAIGVNLKGIDSIDNFFLSNKNLVVWYRIDHNTLSNNFKKSLELLNKYDAIYFTNKKAVIEHSKKRDLYSVVDEKGFEDEIVNAQNTQRQKAQNYISDLERALKKWEKETNKVISKQTDQIENNKKIHLENERIINESTRDVEKIPTYFSDFARSIDDCIYQLKSDKKLSQVRKLYNEKEILFINRINDAKKSNDIKKIQNSEFNIYSQNYIPEVSNNQNPDDHQHHRHRGREDRPMIFFGGILLLSLIFYGLWHSYSSQSDQEILEQVDEKYKVELNANNSTITHATEPKNLFTLNRATFWDNSKPSQFNGDIRGNSISVKGRASKGGAGIVNEGRIMLGGSEKIIITVKNASSSGNIFDEGRLFKLEIDHNVLQTKNMADLCNMDIGYLYAKDGTYEFPLSNDIIRQGYIDKLQIIFYNCTIAALDLSISLE